MRYLLTGATGFLGREVLVRLLASGARVLVTTRRRNDESIEDATARLRAIVERTDPSAPVSELTVAFSDVTAPDLALSSEGSRWIDSDPREPIAIIHGAAEVRFDLAWEIMHRQNVLGTQHVLAFARSLAGRSLLARVDHVSTTFIAGDRTDVALEEETDIGQKPRNDYERSKLEAELELARARSEGLPIVVHRPSIIVGDSRTGRASSFKVLYWPLKVYARGRWRTVFGRPSCTLDIVPVDFVADAIVHLARETAAIGETFHLAAGPERQSTIEEIVHIAEEVFARGRIKYIDPDLYMRWLRPIARPILALLRPDVAERGGVYLPYFRSNPSFAVTRATARLRPSGIAPPKVGEYFGTIARYARETDFGRIAVEPEPS